MPPLIVVSVSSAPGFVVDTGSDVVVSCAVVSCFGEMEIGEVIASFVSTLFVNAAVDVREFRAFACVFGVASSISASFSFAVLSTS